VRHKKDDKTEGGGVGATGQEKDRVKVKELNKREEIKNKDKIEGIGQNNRKNGSERRQNISKRQNDLDNIQ
jgi:hypothetical protein